MVDIVWIFHVIYQYVTILSPILKYQSILDRISLHPFQALTFYPSLNPLKFKPCLVFPLLILYTLLYIFYCWNDMTITIYTLTAISVGENLLHRLSLRITCWCFNFIIFIFDSSSWIHLTFLERFNIIWAIIIFCSMLYSI